MRSKRGVSRALIIGVVVVILVVAVAAGVLLTRTRTTPTPSGTTTTTTSSTTSTPTTPTSTTTSTSSTTPTSTTTAVTPPPNQSTLVVEEDEQPDSLDPAATYETPGWEVVDQVYQGLVAPNGTSVTSYVGVLAQNWTVSPNGMTYTFYLRRGVHFSNGDPFNAYVMWFSIYRTLIMNLAPSFILSQNLAPGNGVNFTVNASILNSINYFDPSPKNLSIMEYPDQSVQVVGPYEIVFHLGFGYNGYEPYNAFLATLTTPMAFAVDPAVVEAHGGVVTNQTNSWMFSNMVGTGFYMLKSWIPGQSITLVKNPNYWADNLSPSQLNYAIQPAIINTIIIYYKPTTARIADLKAGIAQMIEAPVQDYNILKNIPGVNVTKLPIIFGSAQDIYYIYMDQGGFPPFQNKLVREAIAYAIDYQGLIQDVLGGLGVQYIGPVPPGFPYYHMATAGLQNYTYNPVKAAELLAEAGYRATLPNGTVLNPNGQQFPTVNFLYTSDSTTDTEAAQIIQVELEQIGIPVTLSPLTFQQYSGIMYTIGNSTEYPMGIAFYSEDYTASIDYVEAITENGYVSTSAWLNNTVINWTIEAATSSNPQVVAQAFANITRAMYYQYILIWLFTPYLLAVHADDVTGMIPNPAGSGMGYFMFYNTVHYT